MSKLTRLQILILVMLTAVILGACGGAAPTVEEATAVPPTAPPVAAATEPAAQPTALTDPLLQLATIESLEVLPAEPAGSETVVRLRGILPNECTAIDNIVTQQSGDEFTLVVLTIQQPGADCAAAEMPFEEIVALDVSGLAPGSYRVIANDRQVSFTLEAVETPAVEATPTADATAQPEIGAVAGVVWHDLCANGNTAAAETPPGCVLTDSGALLADGTRQDEDGIAGVQVAIGVGECPATAVTHRYDGWRGGISFCGSARGDLLRVC